MEEHKAQDARLASSEALSSLMQETSLEIHLLNLSTGDA